MYSQLLNKILQLNYTAIEFLLDYLETTLEFIPPIQAELTGAVGLGETFKSTPINKQKKFFEKQGFVVVSDKKHLIKMERPFQK